MSQTAAIGKGNENPSAMASKSLAAQALLSQESQSRPGPLAPLQPRSTNLSVPAQPQQAFVKPKPRTLQPQPRNLAALSVTQPQEPALQRQTRSLSQSTSALALAPFSASSSSSSSVMDTSASPQVDGPVLAPRRGASVPGCGMDTLDSPVVASVSAEAKQLDRPIVVVSAFADNVFDDANDAGNPQLVAEYVADIMRHLRTVERRYQPSASYMTQQRDINPKMREVLIDWIVDVHLRFRMQEETLFLAINYIDRFLEVRPVHRSKLQLVGCTALLLAAKYEEIFAPDIRDLVFVSDKACTSKEILHLEGVMLTSLKFNLTVATTLRFLERYTRISGGSEEFVFLVKYLCELALQHYGMLRFLPSQIASAAVLLARRLQSEPEVWTQLLQQHTEYSEADLASCVREIFQILVNPNPRLSAVRRKFASAKYLNVARYPLSELTL